MCVCVFVCDLLKSWSKHIGKSTKKKSKKQKQKKKKNKPTTVSLFVYFNDLNTCKYTECRLNIEPIYRRYTLAGIRVTYEKLVESSHDAVFQLFIAVAFKHAGYLLFFSQNKHLKR